MLCKEQDQLDKLHTTWKETSAVPFCTKKDATGDNTLDLDEDASKVSNALRTCSFEKHSESFFLQKDMVTQDIPRDRGVSVGSYKAGINGTGKFWKLYPHSPDRPK
jgi:hypothetical protein